MTITGFDDIDATIAGLQALAAWRTSHPEIRCSLTGTGALCIFDAINRREGLTPADIVRALVDGAPIGTIDKHLGGDDDELMFVIRSFGGNVTAMYHTGREQVCTRRVVGTETVEVPDPDAPLVTVEREIVEWDCGPLLAAS